jgi:hypothetical protein
MTQPLDWPLLNWKEVDGVTPLRAGFIPTASSWWGYGGKTWHHADYEVGMLNDQAYNLQCTPHTWGPIIMGDAYPTWLRCQTLEEQFVKLGYGAGMGQSGDYSTPWPVASDPSWALPRTPAPNCGIAKARAARYTNAHIEIKDSTGMCDWSYPWLHSPLKERGYRGDITLEGRYFNAVTGNNLSPYDYVMEGERAVNLQRCLTLKRWKVTGTALALAGNIRHYFDEYGQVGYRTAAKQLVYGTAGVDEIWKGTNGPMGNYTGHGILDEWYRDLQWDLTLGAPTKARLHALGMDDVAAGMNTEFPGSIWA